MRGIAYSRTQLYWRNIKLFMLFWTLVFIRRRACGRRRCGIDGEDAGGIAA